MRSNIRKGIFTAPVAILLLLGAGFANANPIMGGIVMSVDGATGSATPMGGTDLSDATGIDFTGTGTVDVASLDFAALVGSAATFSDFTFNPSTAVDPLWSVIYLGDAFEFAATSFSIVTQTANFLNLTGFGVLSSTVQGLDDTNGTWTFTMTSQLVGQFGWTSTTLPEPATITLLGLGLMGMGLSRRRKVSH